jgi:hypothetical protein
VSKKSAKDGESSSKLGSASPKGAQRSVPSSPPPAPAKKEESKQVQMANVPEKIPKQKVKNQKSKTNEKEKGIDNKGEDVVPSTPSPTVEPKRSKSKRALFRAVVGTVKKVGWRRNNDKKKPAKDDEEKTPEPPVSTREEAEPKGLTVSKSAKEDESSSELGSASPKGAKRSLPSSPPPPPLAKNEASKKVKMASDHERSSKRKSKNKKSKPKDKEEATEKGEDVPSSTSPTSNPKSFKSRRNLILAALAAPVRRKKHQTPNSPPRTLKKGFVALNQVSPRKGGPKAPAPPKRFYDDISHGKDKAQGYVDSALVVLQDKSKAEEVERLIRNIESMGGFPETRRLSMRDNELVSQMIMAIRNDPRIETIDVDSDVFGTINTVLLFQFVDALRLNLHLKSLTFQGVELGNDFLYALAASLESNFVLEQIDLSRNCFTNEGLAAFCQAVANSNDTCTKVNLKNQTTPISVASEEDVLEAFRQNTTLTDVELDFQSEEGPQTLAEILGRNNNNQANNNNPLPEEATSKDEKLLSVLRYEAERAQELWEQSKAENSVLEVPEDDWSYLYELAVLFDKHKLKKEIQENPEDAFVPATQRRNGDAMTKAEKKAFLFGEFQQNLEGSVSCFNTDGSFLTEEFITKYFKESPEEEAWVFDFHGQWKLFKRFPVHDPARQLIVTKFVNASRKAMTLFQQKAWIWRIL